MSIALGFYFMCIQYDNNAFSLTTWLVVFVDTSSFASILCIISLAWIDSLFTCLQRNLLRFFLWFSAILLDNASYVLYRLYSCCCTVFCWYLVLLSQPQQIHFNIWDSRLKWPFYASCTASQDNFYSSCLKNSFWLCKRVLLSCLLRVCLCNVNWCQCDIFRYERAEFFPLFCHDYTDSLSLVNPILLACLLTVLKV